jgi:hypothetical protein
MCDSLKLLSTKSHRPSLTIFCAQAFGPYQPPAQIGIDIGFEQPVFKRMAEAVNDVLRRWTEAVFSHRPE